MKTAIIVDDDPHLTELYSDLLENPGLNILGIGQNGHDAIRLFQEHAPDIVFLDVNMPDLDGLKAFKEIKKKSPTTQVVMVTENLSKNLEKMLHYSEATAIILKPFDEQKIEKILEKMGI